MKAKILPPIHSGEILREEFLEPMGISQYGLAKSLSVAARRINDGVNPQMTGYRIKLVLEKSGIRYDRLRCLVAAVITGQPDR